MENQLNNQLPNAQTAFILGVLSIIPGCFCGIVGLILGIVGFIMGKKAIEEYEANPDAYSSEDYQKAQNGKKFSMIGMILFAVITVLYIIAMATGTLANITGGGGF